MPPVSKWRAFLSNVVLRVVVWYALIGAALAAVVTRAPTGWVARHALGVLAVGGARARAAATAAGEPMLSLTVTFAMVGAALLALPVAWVYVLTRAKRGYQQSVVQTLVLLPTVVAGVVVLVRDSLALAFSLAGIVAAVRFRTVLDDSKDAVCVFVATGIGLAAAVDLPVAIAISALYNTLLLLLWGTDFGRTPAHLDGKLAERRLQRAMAQLSRTGSFVARIDDEVLRDMTAEQLQLVAERAARRARQHAGDGGDDDRPELRLRVRTYDAEGSRRAVEPLLQAQLKRWRYGGVVHEPDGTDVVEYAVQLKRSRAPEELLDLVRAACGANIVGAEMK